MDCTKKPQRWNTPDNAHLDFQISDPVNTYTSKEPFFTQQLNNFELGPENGNQTQHAWFSAAPPSTSQPASYTGTVDPTSYTTNAFWTSTTAPGPKYYASNPDSEHFMTSAFLDLGPMGAETFNPSSASANAYPGLGIRDEKPTLATLDLNEFENDLNAFANNGLCSDENNTIINLSHFPATLQDPIDLPMSAFHRRRSSSSFVSSAGPMHDPPELSYASDCTPQSSLNLSSTGISPVEYSRCGPQEMVRSSSRSKATPSPRPSLRTNPYPMDVIRENQSSSDSSSASPPTRPSPYPCSSGDSCVPNVPAHSHVNPPPVLNNCLPSSNLKSSLQYTPFGGVPRFHQPMMPPSSFDPTSRIETVPYMLANGTFRTLQSNALPGGHVHDHFCDHADPPDLFGPLTEEQLVPLLGDMKPDDAELTPHEQEVRFEGDLYTPRFVRGHGNKREGWCGICKPGRWLVLKNSAYWYDKSFSHGVSAASGQAFEGPRDTRRMDGNADVWEGLCGSCLEWIALVSSKKKGTTWFRHAYKCHTHSKVKDAPKRRRESHHRRPSMPNPMAIPSNGPGTLLPSSSLNPMPIQSGRIENVAPFRTLTSMIQ